MSAYKLQIGKRKRYRYSKLYEKIYQEYNCIVVKYVPKIILFLNRSNKKQFTDVI